MVHIHRWPRPKEPARRLQTSKQWRSSCDAQVGNSREAQRRGYSFLRWRRSQARRACRWLVPMKRKRRHCSRPCPTTSPRSRRYRSTYDSTLEVVTEKDQKFGLASSGTVTLNRPDKLHATRTGGFANIEMVFDGKTLTLLGKNANLFAKAEEPGTIDQLVDVLRKKYDRPVPAADLLMSNPYDELIPLVVECEGPWKRRDPRRRMRSPCF